MLRAGWNIGEEEIELIRLEESRESDDGKGEYTVFVDTQCIQLEFQACNFKSWQIEIKSLCQA
jgi:hypothetical protein